jgi:hypothetical protein
MSDVPGKTEDETGAIKRLPDDSPSVEWAAQGRNSRRSPLHLPDEPSAEERAAQRRAARIVFRLYCVSCGRSSEVAVAPVRPGRCVHCDGTMLVEVAAD